MKTLSRAWKASAPGRHWLVVLAVLVLGAEALVTVRYDLQIRIQGSTQLVARGTRVIDAARPFLLQARKGNLVDVEGSLLKRGVFHQRIVVNGRVVPEDMQLRRGDDVRVLDGTDRIEPRKIETFEVFGGEATNPEFQLATARGVVSITRGRLSRKVASLSFKERDPGSGPDTVALTFDDGPNPQNTPAVLEILKRYRVPATFFVVGQMAEAYPDLVRAEAEAGMLIANHSWSHPQHPSFSRLSAARATQEMQRTSTLIESLSGKKPRFFRPPGGAYNDAVVRIANSFGMRTVIWSVDPSDWRNPSPDRIVQRVMSQVKGGSIVLMHDGGGRTRRSTIAALPTIIEGIRKKGLRFVTLD